MQKKTKKYMIKAVSLFLATMFVGVSTAFAGPVSAPAVPAMPGTTQPQAAPAFSTAATAYNQSPQVVREQTQTTLPGQNGAAYLGGASLTLLAPATISQNMSFVLQTKNGSLIVIDGGLREDAPHLIQTIQEKGGRVAAWLITHPHSDHIGALTEILNQNPAPVQIDNIYYSFLERDTYQRGEHMGRMGDLDNLLAAFQNVSPEKLHTPLSKGQKIQVDDVTINVMNLPFRSLYNTFNNSSIAYRLDVNGKRILFLGDMGWDAGQNLLEKTSSEELKADVVQMAHHGQDGVEEGVYRVIRPEICLWPTPDWLWDNALNGQFNTGPWKTLTVRRWMENMGVQMNFTAKGGDQVLR